MRGVGQVGWGRCCESREMGGKGRQEGEGCSGGQLK